MKITYKAAGTSLTPSLKKYIEDKIVRPVKKLFKDDEAVTLDIEFARTTNHHRKGFIWHAEANLSLGKKMIRAEQEGEDPHTTIDEVGQELLREIKAFKGKSKTKEIRGARKIKRIVRSMGSNKRPL